MSKVPVATTRRAGHGITSRSQGCPSAVKHCQSLFRYGYPMIRWYRPVLGKKRDVGIRRADHPIGVAVGTAGKMGVERHHIVEQGRGVLAPDGPGQQVQFLHDTVAFADQAGKLVGVAFAPHLEKKGEEILPDAADIHGTVLTST